MISASSFYLSPFSGLAWIQVCIYHRRNVEANPQQASPEIVEARVGREIVGVASVEYASLAIKLPGRLIGLGPRKLKAQ